MPPRVRFAAGVLCAAFFLCLFVITLLTLKG